MVERKVNVIYLSLAKSCLTHSNTHNPAIYLCSILVNQSFFSLTNNCYSPLGLYTQRTSYAKAFCSCGSSQLLHTGWTWHTAIFLMNALIPGKIHYNYIHFRLMTNNPGKCHLEEEKNQWNSSAWRICFSLALETEWHLLYFPFQKTGTW